MPLREILDKVIRSYLIAPVWWIREPQTEQKNLHARVPQAKPTLERMLNTPSRGKLPI